MINRLPVSSLEMGLTSCGGSAKWDFSLITGGVDGDRLRGDWQSRPLWPDPDHTGV